MEEELRCTRITGTNQRACQVTSPITSSLGRTLVSLEFHSSVELKVQGCALLLFTALSFDKEQSVKDHNCPTQHHETSFKQFTDAIRMIFRVGDADQSVPSASWSTGSAPFSNNSSTIA